jgi:hypothetical protein
MLLYTLVSLLVVAAPSTDGWATYSNARYGYSIGIPPGLVGQGESENGDGQQFQDASGKVRLRVWASHKMEDDERRTYLESWREQGIRVTYQPRGKGWWVLSGEDKEGRILYLKQLEKNGVLYSFEWSHPKGAKTWQDATARIARGFSLP